MTYNRHFTYATSITDFASISKTKPSRVIDSDLSFIDLADAVHHPQKYPHDA